MPPAFWTIGCLTGAAAVATGAFGAHGLKKIITDPSKIRAWETAAHYQVTAPTDDETPPLTTTAASPLRRPPYRYRRRPRE